MCGSNNKYGNEAVKIFGIVTEQEEHSCDAKNICEVGVDPPSIACLHAASKKLQVIVEVDSHI
jgi:hypothetical protein